jgi:hypothetical protein
MQSARPYKLPQYKVLLERQGVTKRCRPSLLTNSALVYESKWGEGMGGAGSQPMSTAGHITRHGAQINFGDLPPYITNVKVKGNKKW